MTAGTDSAQSPGGYGPDVPSPARIHNYWQGGSANYEADRAVAAGIEKVLPQVRQMAADAVLFDARTVGYAASQGVRQFIVLGCGLQQQPPALHDIARSIQEAAVVAYVDQDLTVCDELGDRYAGLDGITVMNGDPLDPAKVLAGVAGVIGLGRPVCVLASAVPHYAPPGQAGTVIAGYSRRLAQGSMVSACVPHIPDTVLWRRLGRLYTPGKVYRYTAKTLAGTSQDDPRVRTGLLAGLDLVPPGITTAAGLQPGWGDAPRIPVAAPCVIAAIGRKTRPAAHGDGCACGCGGAGWCGLCEAAGCPSPPGR